MMVQTATENELRILILEDTPTDAELMEYQLRKGGVAFVSQRVDRREAFIRTLETFRPGLILSDYHTSNVFTAAWQRDVPYLREIHPYPTLHIHPDTASARGIKNGDWVRVESPHGRIKVKAELYPGIRPDTVMMLHGWWQGCEELGLEGYGVLDGGANVNMMYSVDPQKAFNPLITAKVYRAARSGVAVNGQRSPGRSPSYADLAKLKTRFRRRAGSTCRVTGMRSWRTGTSPCTRARAPTSSTLTGFRRRARAAAPRGRSSPTAPAATRAPRRARCSCRCRS